VTEGHSDVFQGQPTDSVPLELSDPPQVWLIQHQAVQLAPYGMPVCAGANLAALDTALNIDCTYMEVCQGCDEESYADLGSLVLRMPCHTLGMCVVPLYSYPWLFPSRHYAVLELEEEYPLSSPQLEDEVGVPSADAVTGSHFLAREAPQNFPAVVWMVMIQLAEL